MDDTVKKRLPIGGYFDHMEWAKMETPDGDIQRFGVFPITRYRNILNRPRIITEESSMAATTNADFHFLTTEVEEVSDDLVFGWMGQIW